MEITINRIIFDPRALSRAVMRKRGKLREMDHFERFYGVFLKKLMSIAHVQCIKFNLKQ